MRNRQYLTSKHRIGTTPACKVEPGPVALDEDLIAAAVDALNDMGNIVSHQCFTRPDTLTPDRITAYALALMRLRECASAAGFGRLMNACDALAVTVSRLIEDQGCACREKCAALTRFVVHAQAMIRMSIQGSTYDVLPGSTDVRTASERVSTGRQARVSV